MAEDIALQIAKYIHHEVLHYEKWPHPACSQCEDAASHILRLIVPTNTASDTRSEI